MFRYLSIILIFECCLNAKAQEAPIEDATPLENAPVEGDEDAAARYRSYGGYGGYRRSHGGYGGYGRKRRNAESEEASVDRAIPLENVPIEGDEDAAARYRMSAKPAKDRKEDQVSQNVHPYFIYYWLLEMDDDILMKNRHSFEGHLGENVSLNCQDKDNFNGNDDRFWRRLLLNGTLENLFFGSEKITADPRFGISRDGNLTIEDLSPGYFGIYDCSPPSHSPFSRGSIAYAVKAYIPPKVSAVKSMIVAPEDDQVTLKCMATGYPQPDIIWKRNYEEKEMFDDQIIAQRIWISSNINIPVKIQDVRKDTILYYKCYIGNEVITSYMSKWFTYEEILSAKPAEDQKEDRFPFPWLPSVRTNKRTGVHAYEYGSENVTFSCQVDDIGDDVRLWRRELLNGTSTDLFFGGEKITGDSRFRISRDGNLTIEYVYPDDSGKYICSVSNRSQTVLHTLYVGHVEWTTSGLVPNVATKLVKEEDGRVTLGCEATGILPPKLLSRPEIIWFKRKRDEKRNVFNAGERFGETITISTLTISNVNEAYGSFECMATNLAGTDEARISVEAQKWCFKEPSWKNCFIYTVKPEKMYWGDGVALCKKEGAEMVTITSEDENKCILDLIPSNAWIGSLYGSKYWVDGTTVVWKNWYSNTFDGHTVGYISKVHSGNWFTVSSLDARLTVVCKKKKESCPTECKCTVES